MATESEQKQPRPSQQAAEEATTKKSAEVETQEGAVPEGVSAEQVYVDPYKQVLHPYELPANSVAAAAILATGNVVVSDEVPISDERAAQAQEAIQAHQDNVQATVEAVGEDPRLSAATPSKAK